MKWRLKPVAAHGGILTTGGCKAQIAICGFIRENVNKENKEKFYLGGIPIAWTSVESLRVPTSSYAGDIRDARRGCDTALLLKAR